MRTYQVDIHLTHEQIKAFYSGAVSMVSAVDSHGVRLQFPLQALRPFVGHAGVHGRFVLRVDGDSRLQRIDPL